MGSGSSELSPSPLHLQCEPLDASNGPNRSGLKLQNSVVLQQGKNRTLLRLSSFPLYSHLHLSQPTVPPPTTCRRDASVPPVTHNTEPPREPYSAAPLPRPPPTCPHPPRRATPPKPSTHLLCSLPFLGFSPQLCYVIL